MASSVVHVVDAMYVFLLRPLLIPHVLGTVGDDTK